MTKLVLLGSTTTNDVMTYEFDRTPALLLSPFSNCHLRVPKEEIRRPVMADNTHTQILIVSKLFRIVRYEPGQWPHAQKQ